MAGDQPKRKRENIRHGGTNYAKRRRTISRLKQEVAAGRPCALCGRPIDLTLPQTYVDPKDGKTKRAPWSFECDEIVPVCQGGLPYGPNCQPAHRICNQQAGAKRKSTKHNPTKRRIVTLPPGIAQDVQIKPKTSREW